MQRLPSSIHSKIIQFVAYPDALRLSRATRLFMPVVYTRPEYGSAHIGRLVHTASPTMMSNMKPRTVWRVLRHRWCLTGRIIIPARRDQAAFWDPCPEWFEDARFAHIVVELVPNQNIAHAHYTIIKYYTEHAHMVTDFISRWLHVRNICGDADYGIRLTIIKYLFASILLAKSIVIMLIDEADRYTHLAERIGIFDILDMIILTPCEIDIINAKLMRHKVSIIAVGWEMGMMCQFVKK